MPLPTNRRSFLRDSLLVTAGAAAGAMLPQYWSLDARSAAKADEAGLQKTPEQRLTRLGIELPPAPRPVAVYVPAVVVGEVLYAAGHGPLQIEGTPTIGKVGRELTLAQGHVAARTVGLAMLSTLRNTLGSLDRVVRLVKTVGMVNCTTDFTQQPQVVNGFSELMVEVFGEQLGKGARSAVGMGSLPGNIAVEIEAVFRVEPQSA